MSERSIRDRIPYIKLPAYVKKALEMFEDNDDVQEVWHNWENEN